MGEVYQGVTPSGSGLSPSVEPVPVSPAGAASIPNAHDPSTWACGCVAHQIKALMAMAEAPTDFPVLSFALIAQWSGLSADETITAVRQLAKKGAAEFWRCSWSDDGEPRGAGYGLTEQGRRAASAIEARRAETGTGSVEDESAAPKADAQGAAALKARALSQEQTDEG